MRKAKRRKKPQKKADKGDTHFSFNTYYTAQGGFTKDIKNVSFFAKQVAKAIIMY